MIPILGEIMSNPNLPTINPETDVYNGTTSDEMSGKKVEGEEFVGNQINNLGMDLDSDDEINEDQMKVDQITQESSATSSMNPMP